LADDEENLLEKRVIYEVYMTLNYEKLKPNCLNLTKSNGTLDKKQDKLSAKGTAKYC